MTPPPRVRPFPFDQLARVAWSQVEAGRALLAHLPLGPLVSLDGKVLAGPVELRLVEAYAFPVRELTRRLAGSPPPTLVRLGGLGDRAALLVLDALLVERALRPASRREGERALVELLDGVCATAGVRVEGVVDGASLHGETARELFPDPRVLALDVRVRLSEGEGRARLWAPERLRLRPPVPRRTPTERLGWLARARVALAMEVGRTRLARAELAGIAPGDVVSFDEFGPRPPLGGPLRLRLGGGFMQARLDGAGLTILQPFELGVTDMEAPERDEDAPRVEAAGDEGSRDALLRELPVEVVCELGRVTLTGRELLSLRPGAVLPVGRPLAGPVDLVVGGRVVARGELVDVEGEVGVRITQVSD